ncbi:60S ribosomal protein L28e [Galdieria sulphuraria]|uniref:60S ribosomal protein L28e n=1 Tax=Galdieria sulphuraria TaxID=130081 RepID=M2X7R8_GALSU|nr:60S ribosomal protein L28e [Galdieria sulphuraria]EME25862.1 60S ribosomal protein L28e [Galdieria sulphuraria]|eukprot:XP_005702382.1 60S ribosomal protein L28e [Galdieria sulphuraria]
MSELMWLLVKGHNAFQIRRKGVTLSTEKGNLKGINSFKYSGLAQSKAVDIQPATETSGIAYSKKRTKKDAIGKPSKMFHTKTLKKGFPRCTRVVLKELSTYRPDLKRIAIARVSKIMAIQKMKRLGKKRKVKLGRYSRSKK